LKYRVITVSPKRILTDSHFQVLWKLKKFGDKLFNVTFDEGHCISEWGDDFRPLYGQLGNLRWFLPDHTTFHVVLATMPPYIISDVKTKLRMRSYNLAKIIRSNDHPNINLIVEEMKFPRNSMHDLTRVMDLRGGLPPEKFMLFTNSRGSAESACNRLHTDLSPHLRDKIIWFHFGMTMEFHIEAIEKLRWGEIWGICCTDAAGMGLDLRDITLIIQWGYTASLCTLMQRLGRGTRDPSVTAVGIYLCSHPKKKARSNPQGTRVDQEGERDEPVQSEAGDEGFDGLELEEEMDTSQPEVDREAQETSRGPSRTVDTLPLPVNPPRTSDSPILPRNLENSALERYTMYAFINAHNRAKRKFKTKPYTMSQGKDNLHKELVHWREMKMIEEDLDGDDFFGPQIIMSNKILHCIIDLAHYFKLTTPTSLLKQMGWCYSMDYGPEIIQLIKVKIPFPVSQPSTTITHTEADQAVGQPGPSILATSNVPNINLTTSNSTDSCASVAPLDNGAVLTVVNCVARKCKACGSTLHIGKPALLVFILLTR
ncbi:hypothetical protein BDN67DRAFT_912477, partial [Paxillus ammoniavirescens]